MVFKVYYTALLFIKLYRGLSTDSAVYHYLRIDLINRNLLQNLIIELSKLHLTQYKFASLHFQQAIASIRNILVFQLALFELYKKFSLALCQKLRGLVLSLARQSDEGCF